MCQPIEEVSPPCICGESCLNIVKRGFMQSWGQYIPWSACNCYEFRKHFTTIMLYEYPCQVRSCLETIHLGQTLQNEAGHGDVNLCLIGSEQALVTFAEPTCVVETTQGPLDHPATRQQHKAADFFGAKHHREVEFEPFAHPLNQAPGVATVYPDPAQFFATTGQIPQEQPGAVPILHTGRSHHTASNRPKVSTRI